MHRDVTDDCVTCHVEHAGIDAELRPFDAARFDHAAETGFPLDGLHAPLARECSRCHKTRSFLTLSSSCASCHADVHKGTLGSACLACHSTGAPFRQASRTFDHDRSAFPLTGAHQKVSCTRCHRDGRFKGLAFQECSACHRDPHDQRFGARCASCHDAVSWRTEKVDHDRTAFKLVGRHRTVACVSCHRQPPMRARLEFSTCVSCYSDPHGGTFAERCEACHDATGFERAGSTFDHASRSKFPLDGRHAGLPCSRCHTAAGTTPPPARARGRRAAGAPPRGLDYRGLRADCASCHADPHKAELGADCARCHSSATFAVTDYTHRGLEGFFVGRHARLECAACHKREPGRGGDVVRFKTGAECSACHEDAHQGAMRADCAPCHSPEQWAIATRGFHKSMRFPVEGRHLAVPCQACHVAGQLAGTPVRCFDCHWIRRQDDRYQTRLGSACEECHRPTSWTAVRWDHGATTGTPLNAAHQMLACDACHREQRFSGTRPECVACHERSFRETRDPDHVAAGFPTQCDLCHQAVSPTFAGAHFAHADNYRVFSCLTCHDRAKTDSKHRNRSGYVYDSMACYSCHPTGRG